MKKVEISHPDKILFPKSKITKGEMADYYSKAAPLILPLIKDRPISMHRFPMGIDEEGFFQKNIPEGAPKWIKTVEVERKEKEAIHMVLCNDKATLMWIVNQNCITPHIWLSKYDKPDLPDRMIFDLDPPNEKSFVYVVQGAKMLREILEKKYKLKAFLTTTGSRGLHVVVPIKRKHHFDAMREFAKKIAKIIVDAFPQQYTLEPRKDKRKGRVYIDVLRNALGQTVMIPYAVRPKEGAPVATPLFWKELENSNVRSNMFNIFNIETRFKRNPWQNFHSYAKMPPIT